MGLFSKEACAFCGKEVGVMSRSKIQGGEYVCTECKYLTHPFLRIDHMNHDKVQAVMDEMKANEEYFQTIQFRKTERRAPGKTYIFYDNYETGEFSLYTPETEKYKNHFVYNMAMVRPYDKTEEWNLANGAIPQLNMLTKTDYQRLITLTERKGADGKSDGWEMYIPYFREDMDITIRFPSNMKADDVKYFHDQVVNIISSYNTTQRDKAVENRKMQDTNLKNTANAAFKAILKGEGTDGIVEAVKEGVETSNEINEGNVKRGLFGRLKKK